MTSTLQRSRQRVSDISAIRIAYLQFIPSTKVASLSCVLIFLSILPESNVRLFSYCATDLAEIARDSITPACSLTWELRGTIADLSAESVPEVALRGTLASSDRLPSSAAEKWTPEMGPGR
jgi:hypothetical protein